jgi:hypothetical protein
MARQRIDLSQDLVSPTEEPIRGRQSVDPHVRTSLVVLKEKFGEPLLGQRGRAETIRMTSRGPRGQKRL